MTTAMKAHLVSFLAGLLFGAGLIISDMTNPAKVLAFLDLFGAWDPSLAFVMLGAIAVTAIGYRVLFKRASPLLADAFQTPTNRTIDTPLAIGSALFGVGWGLAGLCPGPALTAISFGGGQAALFVIAMFAGFGIVEWRQRAG